MNEFQVLQRIMAEIQERKCCYWFSLAALFPRDQMNESQVWTIVRCLEMLRFCSVDKNDLRIHWIDHA